jgi:hypothetical protein
VQKAAASLGLTRGFSELNVNIVIGIFLSLGYASLRGNGLTHGIALVAQPLGKDALRFRKQPLYATEADDRLQYIPANSTLEFFMC